MLLLALIVALILRFYRLGQLPPGLYRDEALNGLDALKVLQGQHALFFSANNGREPLYIYLTSAAVFLLGPTALAVRFAAALVGTLTTLPVYLLGRSWYGWRVGVLAAWLWAITLWPIHLSRIGLRVILLAPLLTLAFWLGTTAFRRSKAGLWFLSGLVYGLTFYTYLAARFTPIFLLLLLTFLLLRGRKRDLWPGVLWFVLGAFLVLLPFAVLVVQQPELFIGRSGQVSILHPDVNGGQLGETVGRHIMAALGMFFIRGDSILRHNPDGRPIFDLFMIIPFLLGLFWSIRHWRRPASMALLLWMIVMLGPTILAADAPHFLRAAGILPAIVFLPAVGLDLIWLWNRLSTLLRSLLVAGLMLGSLLLTVRDYAAYGRDPQVANAFESVAADLAQHINDEEQETILYLDQRLWTNWPSLEYLTNERGNMEVVSVPNDLPERLQGPVALYLWPYEPLNFIPDLVDSPALITASGSGLVYGELDDSAYKLYVRYLVQDVPPTLVGPAAFFEEGLVLRQADVLELADNRLQVDVYWQVEDKLEEEVVVFVHVLDEEGLLAQHDAPPVSGNWPADWWHPGQIVLDRHVITLPEPYEIARHKILVGLYRAASGERLLLSDAATDEVLGTAWTIDPE